MKLAMISLTLVFMVASPSAFAASNMKSITRDQVNVRKGPGLNHDVSYRAPLGYPIQVERSHGDWIMFKDWEGNRGWVNRALVGDVKTVVVMRDVVNLRQGPTLQQSVLNKTTRGMIYKVLRSNSGWFKLGFYDNNEAAGWVRNDLVWGQ